METPEKFPRMDAMGIRGISDYLKRSRRFRGEKGGGLFWDAGFLGLLLMQLIAFS